MKISGNGSSKESSPPAFAHGVASGDPLDDRVVIWTRVSGEETTVDWAVATDSEMSNVIRSGTARTKESSDLTVKVDVDGLEPGSTYFYRFEALGSVSQVGRTKTLPSTGTDHIRFAMVSCAKYNAGYFNAYSRIADREDLQFLLHLGDYIYEAADKPPPSQFPGADIGRHVEPTHECKTLDDYRRRYSQYHRDPDVQRLHLAHPIVPTVDDHEFADGVWSNGSVEHREDRDGPWAQRRAAAFQARWEWLPARPPDVSSLERVWRRVPVSDLADIFLMDTRTLRHEPMGGDALLDPDRSQLGAEQLDWLLDELSRSNSHWRLIGNSSVMSATWNDQIPEEAKPSLIALKMITSDGLAPDPDQWDGYPIEREKILRHMKDERIDDVVVLSGDVHVSIASELWIDDESVAVEFVTPSLTSQNIDEKLGWEPRTKSVAVEEAYAKAMPHYAWCEFESHGYVLIDLTRERLTGQWWYVDTVLESSDGERLGGSWAVERGKPQVLPG